MAHDVATTEAPINERKLGVTLFNKTWSYIDNQQRTPAETEAMLHAAHASFWHWSQAPEATGQNLNIGYWQLSRVYALAGKPEMALYFGERCRETAFEHDLAPFYKAYAYEALARASQVAGQATDTVRYLAQADEWVPQIVDKDERDLIDPDLAQLR